jgi:hypothetical protein
MILFIIILKFIEFSKTYFQILIDLVITYIYF